MAVLSVVIETKSIKGSTLVPSLSDNIVFMMDNGMSDSRHFSPSNHFAENQLPADTSGIVCPEHISTYTDLNSCSSEVSGGLNIDDPNQLLVSLSWHMTGATVAESPQSGINQINSYVFNEGTTEVSYQGKDLNNNSVFCSFTVTVADNQVPRLQNNFENLIVGNDLGDCSAMVSWPDPVVSDNCASSGHILINSNYSPGNSFEVGTTEVIYLISDGVDYNDETYRFSVTVNDQEAPEIFAPSTIEVKCGEPVPDAYTSWQDFYNAGGLAFDNCNIDYSSFRYAGQKSSGIFCPYFVTRTYSIADSYGNISEVEHLLLVEGDETSVTLKSASDIAGTDVYTSSGTFTAPAGVASIKVYAWGGGGGGAGSTTNKYGGGGGGGGAYTANTSVAVVPGTSYSVVIGSGGTGGTGDVNGADGGASSFGGTTVVAAGGSGGIAPNSSTGGAGGAGGTYSGGAGGQGQLNNNTAVGGGGGSSAGTASNGNAGGVPAAGAAVTDGGAGGAGGTSGNNGSSGFVPGGGGGGAGNPANGTLSGGSGARGQVIIDWDCPTSAGTLSGDQNICTGVSTTYTSSVAGGTWSSSNTGIATINSTSGLVTGIADGTAVMTYTVDAGGTCSPQTATRTINVSSATPATPGSITGSITQCPALSGQTYSISSVSDATTYTWSVPTGWSITSGQNTTTITVTTGSAGQNGSISVTASGLCGTSTASTLAVTVAPGTPATPGAISGTKAQCPAQSGQTYSISSVSDATTYTWSVPAGWSITSGQGTTSINVTTGTAGQNGSISVTAGNSCGTSTASTLAVTVEPGTPETPGAISGTKAQCPAQSGQTYSISSVSDATTYTWSVPTGWSITSGQGTTSINVTTGTAGQNGSISVTAGNSCGTSTASTLAVTVEPGTPATPGAISGTSAQCPALSGQTYSISSVSNATTYTWSVPTGWSITSGENTTSITVTTGSAAQDGNISVTAGNSCGTSTASTFAVTVEPGTPATPGAISGTKAQCPAQSGQTYSISSVSDATTYTWSVPTGWSITSGQGTTSINVTTGTAGQNGSISVTAGNSCGTSTASTFAVTVAPGTPATPGAISGTSAQCPALSGQTYSISSVSNATTYTWSVPTGWSITSGQNTTSITVTTGNAGQDGNISVTAGNSCGTSTASTFAVTVEPGTPATPGAISGTSAQCPALSGQIYSISSVSNATTYTWSVPAGWSITSGQNTTSIIVTTGSAAQDGNISVTAGNSCGTSTASTFAVTVEPGTPATPGAITGTSAQCPNLTAQTYSISSVSDATTYTWSVPAGWSITSGDNTTSITVTTGSAGQDGNISVTAGNSCGTSTASTLAVTVFASATVDAGPAMDAICQGQSTAVLGGSFGGSATAGTWSSSVGGTFTPASNDVNATWTPPAGFDGNATLTLTATGPCADIYDSKIISVYEQPAIVVQPVDMTDCYQRVVEFNVTVTGSGLTYTWYRYRSGTDADFIALDGSETYVDVSTPGTLHLTNVGDNTHNPDGTQYKVIVSNGNCDVESNEVTLTVNRITAVDGSESPVNSTSVTLCSGSNFSYSVTTNHPENVVAYQWNKWILPGNWDPISDGGSISGTQTATLQFTNATTDESGLYKISIDFLATSALGCTSTSENFSRELTILSAMEPVITADQAICSGSIPDQIDGTVSGGSGTSYTYQWQDSSDASGWNNISAATAINYQPPALVSTTSYRLVVTDSGSSDCGSATSNRVTIVVDPPPTAKAGGSQTICPNTTATVSGASASNYSTVLWTHNGAGSLADETTFTPTYTPDPGDADKTITLTMTVTGDGICGASAATATASYLIHIESLQTAEIAYPNPIECNDAGVIEVINSGSGGGVFSSSPAGLVLDESSGEIDANASSPGAYEIVYLIAATGTCNQESDTVSLVINELPDASIAGDAAVCEGSTQPEVTFTASGGTANYTFYYTINNGAVQSVTTSGGSNTVTVVVPTNVVGTFVYKLDSVKDASSTACVNSSSGTATVIVNELPSATISGTTTVCQYENSSVILFSGSGGALPYTFRYRINGGALQTVKTNGGSTAIEFVDTNTPGTYVYSLYDVEDGSTTDCVNDTLTGSATVTVKELPEVTITATTSEVCQGESSPQITFTGSNGEAPYSFIYRVNDGAFQTVTTAANDSVYTISVPTSVADTLVYEVTSVFDSGASSCLVSVDETYEIVVSPPPEAIVELTDSIPCVGGTGEVTIVSTIGTPLMYYFGTQSSIDGVFSGISAGTYDWYVTDLSSCDPASGQFTIEDPLPISFNAPVITDVSCPGASNGSVVIAAENGKAPKTYTISPDAGVSQSPSGTFTGLAAQSYVIEVTDANSCTYDTTIVVGTVADIIAPVIVDCPPNDTLYTEDIDPTSCEQIVSWTEPTATDNCSDVANITVVQSHNPGDLFPINTTTWVSYIFTDEQLNSDTCKFGITVFDNTAPVPPALPSLDSQCSVTITPPVASDACDGAISGTTTTTFPVTAAGLTTITWTFTDGSGNTATANQIVFIEDDESPVWINGTDSLFSILNIECHEDTSATHTGIPQASDNCSDVTITYSDKIVNKVAGECLQYEIIRTWTVRDSSGNSRTDVQTIAVADRTPPELYCSDTTVNTPDDIWDPYELRGISYTDNCGIDTVFLVDEEFFFDANGVAGFCPDSVKRTYRVYDRCAQTSTCTQTIRIADLSNCSICQDVVPYHLVDLDGAPDSLWVLDDGHLREGACCLYTDDNTAWGCTAFNVYLDEDAVGIYAYGESPWPAGTSEYYRVDCSESSGLSDNICLDGGQFYTLTFCKPGEDKPIYYIQSLRGAVATDTLTTRADIDCEGQINVDGLEASTITWSVKYPAGADSLMKYLDTSVDIENPTFRPDSLVPPLIIYEVCGYLEGLTECDGAVIYDCDEVIVNTVPPVEVHLDTDVSAICEDDIPTLTAELPYEDPSYTYTFIWYNGPDASGNVVSTSRSYTPTSLGTYSVLVEEITSGIECNSDLYTFNIVADTVGPALLLPPDTLFLDCSDSNFEAKIITWIKDAAAYLEDDLTVSTTVYDDYTAFDPSCGHVEVVHFWAYDVCSNPSYDSAYIVIQDNVAPVISPEASNATADCYSADPGTNTDYLAWLADYGGARASDDCEPESSLVWTVDTTTAVWQSDGATNSIIITFTVADLCGNTDQTTATFYIIDTVPPTISCPDDFTEIAAADSCSKTPATLGLPAFSDDCAEPVLTYERVLPDGTTDSGTGTVNSLSFPVGTTLVTYTATDDAGLSASCSFNLTIMDIVAPELQITGCENVTEDAEPGDCWKIPATIKEPDYSDNCWPVDSLDLSFVITGALDATGNGSVVGISFPVGVSHVSYTVTDPDGNWAECDFYVTIVDVTPPNLEISNCIDVSGTMDADNCFATPPTIVDPIYSDDCWPVDSLELAFEITNGVWDTTGFGYVSGLEFPVGVSTVSYTVSDPDSNSVSCSFTVTMLRDEIPSTAINCPTDPPIVTLGATECEASLTLDSPTVSDNCVTATYTITNDFNGDSVIVNEIFPTGTTVVNWLITDNSGNHATCTVYVEVTGVQLPTISCPPGVTGTMDASGCYGVTPTIEAPVYSAPCWDSDSLELTFRIENGSWDTTGVGSVSGLEFPVGTNTVWYMVTDPDGNKDSCNFTVTMQRDEIPSTAYTCADNPADALVDSFSCTAWIDIDPPVINDYCVTATYAVMHDSPYASGTDSSDASGYYPIGVNTITWTISDNSGNTATCTQTFEVIDLEPSLECPDNVEVFADANELFASGVTVGLPIYWDNCDSVLTYTITTPEGVTTLYNTASDSVNVLTGGHTYNLGVTTIEYTFRDGSGHQLVCDFTVTVNSAPDIECPPDTTIYLDGSNNCLASFDPGVPDLIEGAPPIDWTYTIYFADGSTTGPITYTKEAPDYYADPLGDIDFPQGLTTIEWRAENEAGYDTCSHWVEVIDTIPPTFSAEPWEDCVESLSLAIYDGDDDNLIYDPDYPSADYNLFEYGDTSLDIDLSTYSDNCCLSTDGLSIRWQIDFDGSESSIEGIGQPSEFVYAVTDLPGSDILLWGDGVNFQSRVHTITYWITDCNGNESDPVSTTITVTPRPELIKESN